jgi:diguanylate cyclase (GGDEF)-like protein
VVARFGGYEFAVNLRETESKESVLLAGRAIDAVRAMAIEHGGQTVRITISVGMCQARAGEGAERWLERADRALYEAKEKGRDRAAQAPPG